MTEPRRPTASSASCWRIRRPRHSVAIPWLAETYRAEIVAVTIDLGQGRNGSRRCATARSRPAPCAPTSSTSATSSPATTWSRGLKAGLFRDDPTATTETLGAAADRADAGRRLPASSRRARSRTAIAAARGGASLANAVRALDPALTLLAVPASMSLPRDERSSMTGLPAERPSVPDRRQLAGRAGVRRHRAAARRADRRSTASRCRGSTWWTASTSWRAPTASARQPLVALDVAHQALEGGDDFEPTPSGSAREVAEGVSADARTTARGSRRCAQALDAYVDKIQERVGGIVRLKLFKGDCTVVECQVSTPAAPCDHRRWRQRPDCGLHCRLRTAGD